MGRASCPLACHTASSHCSCCHAWPAQLASDVLQRLPGSGPPPTMGRPSQFPHHRLGAARRHGGREQQVSRSRQREGGEGLERRAQRRRADHGAGCPHTQAQDGAAGGGAFCREAARAELGRGGERGVVCIGEEGGKGRRGLGGKAEGEAGEGGGQSWQGGGQLEHRRHLGGG